MKLALIQVSGVEQGVGAKGINVGTPSLRGFNATKNCVIASWEGAKFILVGLGLRVYGSGLPSSLGL